MSASHQGPAVKTKTTEVSIPIVLGGDPQAVQVIRLANSLLDSATRSSAAASPLGRMQAVLLSQLAVETLFRCVYERVSPNTSKKDRAMKDVEDDVFAELKPVGLGRPDGLKTLRTERDQVAHDGCVPSVEDVARHLGVANTFCATLVKKVWGAAISDVSHVDLVANERFREWMKRARKLLTDPSFDLIDDAGEPVTVAPQDRPAVAAGIAAMIWKASFAAMAWGPDYARYWQTGFSDVVQKSAHEFEVALKVEIVALGVGIPLSELRRFQRIKPAGVGVTPKDKCIVTVNNSLDEADARFAVDFAIRWVLAVEVHAKPGRELPGLGPQPGLPEPIEYVR